VRVADSNLVPIFTSKYGVCDRDTFNNTQCNGPTSQGAYLNQTAGPIIRAAVENAESCSMERCHGHGRCVDLPTGDEHCDCDPGYLERTNCVQKQR
jgi:hypothetical protein